jgi:hypothetical protein
MMEVLRKFSRLISNAELKMVVETIVSLFDNFVNESHLSGKAWQSLFLIVLLIRLVSLQFDPSIIPLKKLNYSISFNNLMNDGMPFENIEDLSFLVQCMKEPQRYPHVAVYYPRNARFVKFDIIVAVYERLGHRDLYAYQVKEGKVIPMGKDPLDVVLKS